MINLIILSTDVALFEENSDPLNRMLSYGKSVREIYVIVLGGIVKNIQKDNVTVISTGKKNKILNFFYAIYLAININKKNKIDVLITQDPLFIGICGYIISFYLKSKLLVSVYGTNIYDRYWLQESFKNRAAKYIAKYIFRVANAIQTDGYETFDELKKRYGPKVFWKPIVPSNISDFKNINYSTGGREKIQILFIGRLVKQKNIPALIKVISGIVMASRRVLFTIVGDGPLREFLLNEVNKNKLENYVKYIPKCSRKEMVKIFLDHQIFILTSFYEGFAKVFMEAGAAGLPIVTFNVSGVKNIIIDGVNGFVFEQGNLPGFISSLNELITDEKKRIQFSDNMKEYFWDNFSPEMTAKIQGDIFKYLQL